MQATNTTGIIEAYPNYRFTVAIDNIVYGAFTEVQLPNLQVETLDIKEGGQNTYMHRLPVRVNIGTVTLKRGIGSGVELLKWYLQVLNGDIENARKKELTIALYGTNHKPLLEWHFRDVLPIKWVGPGLKSDTASIIIEELEIAHHGFEITTH
ncbi:phage tail protein [Anaerolineales bacterium]